METTPIKTTDYTLIEEFMQYLLTLSSDELTKFYCETCQERQQMPIDSRPTSPFLETKGSCSHCRRYGDVSNPFINLFLNGRGMTLESPLPRYWVRIVEEDDEDRGDETIVLIRDWLIPDDYTSCRHSDICYGEEALFTWINYGRQKAKDLYRCSYISKKSKRVLLPFFPLCYSPERLVIELGNETKSASSKVTAIAITNEDLLTDFKLEGEEHPLVFPARKSTFTQFKAFVISKLQSYKDKYHAEDS